MQIQKTRVSLFQNKVAAHLLLKVAETFSFPVVSNATNSPKNEDLGFLSPHRNCHTDDVFPNKRKHKLSSTYVHHEAFRLLLRDVGFNSCLCVIFFFFLTTFTRIAELWQIDCRLKQKVLRVSLKLSRRTFSSICVGRPFLCLISSCTRAKCRFTSHYPPAAILIHLPTSKPWFYSWNSDFAHHSHWNNP